MDCGSYIQLGDSGEVLHLSSSINILIIVVIIK